MSEGDTELEAAQDATCRTERKLGEGAISSCPTVIRCAATVAAIACLGALGVSAQAGATDGEWRVFGADAGATRYSPLDQIHAGNLADLDVAWRWSARNYGTPPPSGRMQVSPLVIDGILYTTAGNQRSVVAIQAATGETLWIWRPSENERRWGDIIEPVARSSGRGVSYWTDGAGDERIFVVMNSALDGCSGGSDGESGRGIWCWRRGGHDG